MAVSVPRRSPEIVFARRKTEGKCLTRMEIRERKRVIVCSGTSCLKETRKEAWMAMPPEMAVVLFVLSLGYRER